LTRQRRVLRAWGVHRLLAMPAGADEVAHERAEYVNAMREANRRDYDRW